MMKGSNGTCLFCGLSVGAMGFWLVASSMLFILMYLTLPYLRYYLAESYAKEALASGREFTIEGRATLGLTTQKAPLVADTQTFMCTPSACQSACSKWSLNPIIKSTHESINGQFPHHESSSKE